MSATGGPAGRGFYRPEDWTGEYAATLGDPGSYPFTRGTRAPRGAGRATEPGTTIVRELSGEGSAADSNRQFRFLLEHGASGLDVIGDGPTVSYLDPDHPHALHAVGNTGVSLCRGEDYVALYAGIPLDRVSISHSLPSGFAIAGIYLAARAHGHDPATLRGSTILAPMYGEDTAYAGHLPFELHMRLAIDSIRFAAEHMPKFHPFVEDTYFISDGSIGPLDEMALGMVEIREVVRRLVAAGAAVDSFAPRIALLVNCRLPFFEEIAKIRASRRYFAWMMREEFGARDPRSWAVNVTAHTSGASLTSQQLPNNIVRGTAQSIALFLAGVRAMEISAFDEALRTPTRAAHLVGLRTQQIVALECRVDEYADPLGGSYLVESMTDEFDAALTARVAEIERMGSAAELVASGYFRGLFTEAMVERATEVQGGRRPAVGVNCHTLAPGDDTLLRDLAETRIEPRYDIRDEIRAWRATRHRPSLVAALERLAAVAGRREENVVPALIEAFESGATMGEAAGVLRESYGAPYDPLHGSVRP